MKATSTSPHNRDQLRRLRRATVMSFVAHRLSCTPVELSGISPYGRWALERDTAANSDEAAKGKEGVCWEVAEPVCDGLP